MWPEWYRAHHRSSAEWSMKTRGSHNSLSTSRADWSMKTLSSHDTPCTFSVEWCTKTRIARLPSTSRGDWSLKTRTFPIHSAYLEAIRLWKHKAHTIHIAHLVSIVPWKHESYVSPSTSVADWSRKTRALHDTPCTSKREKTLPGRAYLIVTTLSHGQCQTYCS